MANIAFVFPGQGAQTTGMSRDFYEQFDVSKKIFNDASESLGYDMAELIFDQNRAPDLNITENTQPAILTATCAALAALTEKGIYPDYAAGLSLGEYSAHVCAGSISFGDAVSLVRKRGKFMQDAVPVGVGTMAAIIGLDKEKIIEACIIASDIGVVEPANFNCPGQIVISGNVEAVEKACEICKSYGAKRAVLLPVSAPFHSSLLKKAQDQLTTELDLLSFQDMKCKVISNVTAEVIEDKADIKTLLIKQVTNAVRWWDGMDFLIKNGVDTFIEIGPGKTLTGFLKKINSDVKSYNISTVDELNNTVNALISEV